MSTSIKQGDRVVLVPEDLRDGFREADLLDRDPKVGTVEFVHESEYRPEPQVSVKWDDANGSSISVCQVVPASHLTLDVWDL